MEKVFYVSKLENGNEYVICDYSTGWEWEHVDLLEAYGFQTTDFDEAQSAANEYGGTVEYFERLAR